jgi:small subunit ribosomal protein S20
VAKKSLSALKRARQEKKRRAFNRAYKSRVKTASKKVIEVSTKEEALQALREAFSIIDKSVKKGVLHPNTGARRKKLLSKKVASK